MIKEEQRPVAYMGLVQLGQTYMQIALDMYGGTLCGLGFDKKIYCESIYNLYLPDEPEDGRLRLGVSYLTEVPGELENISLAANSVCGTNFGLIYCKVAILDNEVWAGVQGILEDITITTYLMCGISKYIVYCSPLSTGPDGQSNVWIPNWKIKRTKLQSTSQVLTFKSFTHNGIQACGINLRNTLYCTDNISPNQQDTDADAMFNRKGITNVSQVVMSITHTCFMRNGKTVCISANKYVVIDKPYSTINIYKNMLIGMLGTAIEYTRLE